MQFSSNVSAHLPNYRDRSNSWGNVYISKFHERLESFLDISIIITVWNKVFSPKTQN